MATWLLLVGEKRWQGWWGVCIARTFWAVTQTSRCPVHGSNTTLHPLLLGSAPQRSSPRLTPTKERGCPASSPHYLPPPPPGLTPLSSSSPAPLKDGPPPRLSIYLGFGPFWLSSCESRSAPHRSSSKAPLPQALYRGLTPSDSSFSAPSLP